MQRLIAGLVMTIAFTTVAQAGSSVVPLDVEVSDIGGGITRVEGNMNAVRFTEDDVQQIGCRVAANQGGAPNVVCLAIDINENPHFCFSFDPALVDAAQSISPYSYIRFEFDGASQCTHLLVATRSHHILDADGEKGKTK